MSGVINVNTFVRKSTQCRVSADFIQSVKDAAEKYIVDLVKASEASLTKGKKTLQSDDLVIE